MFILPMSATYPADILLFIFGILIKQFGNKNSALLVLKLIFDPEEGDSIISRNVCEFIQNYTAAYPIRY